MSTAMIWQTVSTSSADTERLGELIGAKLEPPAALELKGDLGVGKTTLVRGLARGCGSRAQVASPSFTLSRVYDCNDGIKLHHFDLYRLNDEPGVVAEQLAEVGSDPKSITVVEWGSSVKDILPNEIVRIELSADPDSADSRHIKIEYPEKHAALVEELENSWRESRL